MDFFKQLTTEGMMVMQSGSLSFIPKYLSKILTPRLTYLGLYIILLVYAVFLLADNYAEEHIIKPLGLDDDDDDDMSVKAGLMDFYTAVLANRLSDMMANVALADPIIEAPLADVYATTPIRLVFASLYTGIWDVSADALSFARNVYDDWRDRRTDNLLPVYVHSAHSQKILIRRNITPLNVAHDVLLVALPVVALKLIIYGGCGGLSALIPAIYEYTIKDELAKDDPPPIGEIYQLAEDRYNLAKNIILWLVLPGVFLVGRGISKQISYGIQMADSAFWKKEGVFAKIEAADRQIASGLVVLKGSSMFTLERPLEAAICNNDEEYGGEPQTPSYGSVTSEEAL